MKTLIAYRSKHGSTKNIAEQIAAKLDGSVDIIDVRNKPRISDYDRVIIGGSIHASSLLADVTKFCQTNHDTLLTKPLGLFISCSATDEKGDEQLRDAYDEELRKHATVSANLGGNVIMKDHNFIIRALLRKIMNRKDDYLGIFDDKIITFAKTMNA